MKTVESYSISPCPGLSRMPKGGRPLPLSSRLRCRLRCVCHWILGPRAPPNTPTTQKKHKSYLPGRINPEGEGLWLPRKRIRTGMAVGRGNEPCKDLLLLVRFGVGGYVSVDGVIGVPLSSICRILFVLLLPLPWSNPLPADPRWLSGFLAANLRGHARTPPQACRENGLQRHR